MNFFCRSLSIIKKVIVFRVKRLEIVGHTFSVLLIMVSLRLPLFDIFVRSVLTFLLLIFVFLNNDYLDASRDLSSGQTPEKSNLLLENHNESIFAQIILGLTVILGAYLYNSEILLASILSGGVGFSYSLLLQKFPVLDVLTMGIWGGSIALLSFPLQLPIGWLLAGQLGLLTAVSHSLQALRDAKYDCEVSLETTAVWLGSESTLLLIRALIVISAIYGFLFLGCYSALLMLFPILIPIPLENPGKYYVQIRMVLGIGWISIFIEIFWQSQLLYLW